MNIVQVVVRGVVPLLVIGAGVFGAVTLVRTKPVAEKKPRVERGLLIEAAAVHRADHQVEVRAQGTVVAAFEIGLSTEIGGRITWKNPQLTDGGQLRKGDALLKIDKRDYKLAVAQQRAALARAQAELELEMGRKRVADKEWQLFGKQGQGASALATREPQLKSAKLGLDTAKSGLDQAQLKLDRTIVRAPFNAIVRTNDAEVGRLVAPQQAVANLVNSDVYVVVVSLPVEELQWLRVPGVNRPLLSDEATAQLVRDGRNAGDAASQTSFARITQRVGDGEIERTGFVTRLLGDLDPVGRMARLLVAIRDPLGLQREQPKAGVEGLPLMLGAYVHVQLSGIDLPKLFEIPRLALRDGDRVYVVTETNKLDMREVKVARRRPESVLVKEGLRPGERVITSAMPSAVQGMDLRVANTDELEGGRVELRSGDKP